MRARQLLCESGDSVGFHNIPKLNQDEDGELEAVRDCRQLTQGWFGFEREENENKTTERPQG